MKRFFHLLFMPCDRITGLVSESLDRDLSRSERFAAQTHLLYCVACRRFRRQIRQISAALAKTEGAIATLPEDGLSSAARARIVNALNQ